MRGDIAKNVNQLKVLDDRNAMVLVGYTCNNEEGKRCNYP